MPKARFSSSFAVHLSKGDGKRIRVALLLSQPSGGAKMPATKPGLPPETCHFDFLFWPLRMAVADGKLQRFEDRTHGSTRPENKRPGRPGHGWDGGPPLACLTHG